MPRNHELWKEIRNNKKLQALEKRGFTRGKRKGKTMNVPLGELYSSLTKQFREVGEAYLLCTDGAHLRRCLADLRNVAGCLFLKLDGYEEASR